VAEGEQVGAVVLKRLNSGDDVHGDWELRERGTLVASSRKCRVRERGKEVRRMGSAEPHMLEVFRGASMRAAGMASILGLTVSIYVTNVLYSPLRVCTGTITNAIL
jgi:hypothetical protein